MIHVYFDHNIFIGLSKNLALKERIISKKHKYSFYYSPAHVEEMYSAISKEQIEPEHFTELKNVIKDITNNKILLPSKIGQAIIEKEEPFDVCYERVKGIPTIEPIKQIALKQNLKRKRFKADNDTKYFQGLSDKTPNEIWHEKLIIDKINETNKNEYQDIALTNNIKIYKFLEEFNSFSTQSEFVSKLLHTNHTDNLIIERNIYQEKLKYNYENLETIIESLFNILNSIGYNVDKEENKIISNKYDIAHAIYASKCNYIFTTDLRFYKRCKAVYYFLAIPTKVHLCKF